jgi:hypothetical protein
MRLRESQRGCRRRGCDETGGPRWIAVHEAQLHVRCRDCGDVFSKPGAVVHRYRKHAESERSTSG